MADQYFDLAITGCLMAAKVNAVQAILLFCLALLATGDRIRQTFEYGIAWSFILAACTAATAGGMIVMDLILTGSWLTR